MKSFKYSKEYNHAASTFSCLKSVLFILLGFSMNLKRLNIISLISCYFIKDLKILTGIFKERSLDCGLWILLRFLEHGPSRKSQSYFALRNSYIAPYSCIASNTFEGIFQKINWNYVIVDVKGNSMEYFDTLIYLVCLKWSNRIYCFCCSGWQHYSFTNVTSLNWLISCVEYILQFSLILFFSAKYNPCKTQIFYASNSRKKI